MSRYILIVTTPSYPNGVKYPPFVSRGHASDYNSQNGVHAEGKNERFTLADVDETESKI